MKKKFSKSQTQEIIRDFFKKANTKTSDEVKKIKRLVMSHNIPLRKKRKFYCKKCLTPYTGKEKVRIKKGMKTIICNKCDFLSRWKIK
jgi:RNase P subunit RPR2